jgi:hypothetical protein
MKQSITLVEIIFTIVILSVVLLTSSNLILTLNQKNNEEQILLNQKIDFESTRLFLNHKIKDDIHLDKLLFSTNRLFYDNDILLKNVNSYIKTIDANTITIKLCIKNYILSCQNIVIK